MRGDTVHHDATSWLEIGLYLGDDGIELSAMTSDKNGIRTGNVGEVGVEEITDMYLYARSSHLSTVLQHDGFAFLSLLKRDHMEMWKLQTGLYRYASRTEPDIPKNMPLWQVKALKGEQAYGHLGDHFLSAVEQREFIVRNSEWRG